MANAWGTTFGSAWGSSWGTTPVEQTGRGGFWFGHQHHRSRKDELLCERELLGVIPAKVQAVVEKVVKEQPKEPVRALHVALDRKRIAYRARYAQLLQIEMELRRRDDEEICVALLLLN